MPELITTHRLTQDTAWLSQNIAEDVFDDDLDGQRLATCLTFPGNLMVIAVSERKVIGQVAGYIHCHPDQPSDLYIDNLGVTPRFQRRGVAGRLVDDIFAWAKTLDCHQVWVVTEINNHPARSLYEGRGARAEPIVMFSYKL